MSDALSASAAAPHAVQAGETPVTPAWQALGPGAPDDRPLCANLDGALIATDTLWESVLRLVRSAPWMLLMLPVWLLSGRARLRHEVGKRAALDPQGLPYRQDLLQALRRSAANGRRLVLATAADRQIAEAVASHLSLFDEVLASDEQQLMNAAGRRRRLEQRFGPKGFDYVGASSADLRVLEGACKAYMVGVGGLTARRARRIEGLLILSRKPPLPRALLRLLRPHQWAKNALVFLPLLLSPGMPEAGLVAHAVLATALFSLAASTGYVLNDLLDVEADRAHKTKCHRPFASGALPVAWGPPLFAALFALSFGVALWQMSLPFVAMLGGYFAGTIAYSLWLKSKLMIDVLTLAWLYTHRILAGGVATEIRISAWLLAFSVFFFLSLAFAKRYIELRAAVDSGPLKSRGYRQEDIQIVRPSGVATGYMAVLIYWISRVWFLAHRGQVEDDPVKFALRDRTSWLCGLLVALTAALARFPPGLWAY